MFTNNCQIFNPQSHPLKFDDILYPSSFKIQSNQKKQEDLSNDLDNSDLFQQNGFIQDKNNTFQPTLWRKQDQKKLIELHKKFGNKWTLLSKHFIGSSENFIKNHFYSRLRKSIRKLNKTLTSLFGKKYNKFNLNIIFKLSNISEGKVMGKCKVETQISTFYKDFVYKLIQFSQRQENEDSEDQQQILEQVQNFTLALVALENLFRIISGQRVYKGKKKNIAYLKRFNFRLDRASEKTLVISKQNCFISDKPVLDQYQNQKSFESIDVAHIEHQSDQSEFQIIVSRPAQKVRSLKPEQQLNYLSSLSQSCIAKESTAYYTDDSYMQSSISIYNMMDQQLRQFEMPFFGAKRTLVENLLDEMGSNQIYFDMMD